MSDNDNVREAKRRKMNKQKQRTAKERKERRKLKSLADSIKAFDPTDSNLRKLGRYGV